LVKPIPEGYHSVTPYLALADGPRAIQFYRRALGATELYRLGARNGRIAHAELLIGDSRIMVSDELPEWGSKSARTYGGSPIVLCIYASDVDSLAKRFVSAGGTIVRPLQNQFYGDRSGQFQDPEGYRWTLAQRIEDVSPEEMTRRMATLL
jgi:PhnB protein